MNLREIVLSIVMVTALVAVVFTHALLSFRLFRVMGVRAITAFFVPPLAVVWGQEKSLSREVRAWLWAFFAYVAGLVLSYAW